MRVLARAGASIRSGWSILYAAFGLGLAGMLAPATLGQQLPADFNDFNVVRDVPLPGDTSRFDYESLDSQTHRLYITHLGAGSIVVFDVQAGAVVAEIRDVPGVHGVLAIPDLGRVYATATSSNQVVATVPLGGDVGNTQYDAVSHQIFVAVQTRDQMVTIDPKSDQVSGRYDTRAATIRMACRSHPTDEWPSSPARGTQNWWSWTCKA